MPGDIYWKGEGSKPLLPQLGRPHFVSSIFTKIYHYAQCTVYSVPPAPELPTLFYPEMTASPALTTPLPSSKGKPQPARTVKTKPLISSHCGLPMKGLPGPTVDRCIVPRDPRYLGPWKIPNPWVTCLICSQCCISVSLLL